jgi:hypothetical protein
LGRNVVHDVEREENEESKTPTERRDGDSS